MTNISIPVTEDNVQIVIPVTEETTEISFNIIDDNHIHTNYLILQDITAAFTIEGQESIDASVIHMADTDIHLSAGQVTNIADSVTHIADETLHVTAEQSAALNGSTYELTAANPVVNNQQLTEITGSIANGLTNHIADSDVHFVGTEKADLAANTLVRNYAEIVRFSVVNNTAAIIPKGTIVYPDETTGIGIADAYVKRKSRIIAMAENDLAVGVAGYVVKLGAVTGLNTLGFNIGQIVHLGWNATAGQYVADFPDDGGYHIGVGVVEVIGETDGVIFVDIAISDLTVEITDQNGFPYDLLSDSVLSFTDGTRTFSITPTGNDFHYYQLGDKYLVESVDSIIIPNETGLYAIYYDSGFLAYIKNPNDYEVTIIIRKKVTVAYVYYNAIFGGAVLVNDERHGISMSPDTHAYLHFTRGAQYANGFAPENVIIGNGSLNSHAQFGVSSGAILDEDLYHELNTVISTTGLTYFYRLATGDWYKGTNIGFSFPVGATPLPQYNQWTGTEFQLTELISGNYMLLHVFACPDIDKKPSIIVGINDYNSISDATAGLADEVNQVLTGLAAPEYVPIASFILEGKTSFTNSVNARIVQNSDGEDYRDWRVTEVSQGTGASSHNNLANLNLAGTGVTWGHISDQAQTIIGEKTFDSFPVTPSASPTSDYQVTNKKYIDDLEAIDISGFTTKVIGDVTADVISSVMTEAEFNVLIAKRRTDFAGSGFVEFGKYNSAKTLVQDGLWADATVANILNLGRGISTQAGDSKTDFPYVNVNGSQQFIKHINEAGGYYNKILFPDAPTTENLVTNGTFDTNTDDWVSFLSATLSWNASNALDITFPNPSNWAGGVQLQTLEVGKTYRVSGKLISNVDSETLCLFKTDNVTSHSNLISSETFSSAGVYTFDFVATTINTYIGFAHRSGSSINASTITVDNISAICLNDLTRQDLVFLESWHELVTDKDIVYPYGNVQSLLATDSSTGLTTANGSFTGYETYSLFGNWQASSDLIGKGIVWSTMTDANKKKFVSDPENNVYLNEEGDLVQVRYRMRVVEGLGSDWLILPGDTINIAQYDPDNRVLAQGQLTVGVDLDVATHVNGYYAPMFYGDIYDLGISRVSSNDVEVAYNGLCFALPVALVSRRNQGAFHPVFNSNGTCKFGDSNPWYSTTDAKASTSDCFTTVGDGSITGASSGRPDGKFYDAIYESDVLDLRNSAHKVEDLNRLLTREFNSLVAGEVRGWEQGKQVLLANENPTSAGTVSRLNYTGIGSFAEVGDEVVIIQTGTPFKAFVTVVTTDYIDLENRTYTAFATTATSDTFCLLGERNIETKTTLQCDIIGDPANYPQEWLDNGIMGTPLLVGEEGDSLLPDSTIKTFKVSRKVKEAFLRFISVDNGASWTVEGPTSGWATGIEGATNAWTANIPTNAINLIFYETEASPFELADNAEVLQLGDVFTSNATVNADTVSNLINKIPISSNRSSYKLSQYLVESDLDTTCTPEHIAIDALITTINPACKVLPYVTLENNQTYLQCIFKEMKYDVDWGDDNKFNIADKVSTDTDDNGNTVLIGQKRIKLPFFIGDTE